MTKRIALFFDGTWEKGTADKQKTNVWKLYKATTDLKTKCKECGQPIQPTHYISGVGSDWWNFLSGGIGGRGISEKIKEGYKFLVENYDKIAGDHIYVFGFSRGAYAARSLVGFVDEVGILLEEHIDLVPLAFEIYKETDKNKKAEKKNLFVKNHGFNPFPGNLNEEEALPIYFISVWDTVGSLGIPFPGLHYLTARWVKFHNTELPKNVTHARHALAMHELRPLFEPTLWTKLTNPQVQTFKQCWFPGAHGDVGGGYIEDGLSNTALAWISKEAEKPTDTEVQGLKIDWIRISDQSEKEPQEKVHNELRTWTLGMFFCPRSRSGLSQLYRPIHREPPEWGNEDERNAFWDTIYFHESAKKWLLDAKPVKYPYRWLSVDKVLEDVDTQSVQLFLRLHYRKMDNDTWWRHIGKSHVESCRQQVEAFFANPLQILQTIPFFTISQAIVLLYIFDESRLRNLIEKYSNFTDNMRPLKSCNVIFVLKKARKLFTQSRNTVCAQSNNQGKVIDEYFRTCVEMFSLKDVIKGPDSLSQEETHVGL
jgi:uncharacterized protein (DUF2235 family)